MRSFLLWSAVFALGLDAAADEEILLAQELHLARLLNAQIVVAPRVQLPPQQAVVVRPGLARLAARGEEIFGEAAARGLDVLYEASVCGGIPILRTIREADAIVVEEIKAAGLYRETSQSFAVLLPIQSVGVMGDARTYEDAVAVRSIQSEDFMTADWARLPYEVLERISTRIINEVRGVNRVVYDISSKPPSTIEWE